MKQRSDPHQLKIEWGAPPPPILFPGGDASARKDEVSSAAAFSTSPPLIQVLPWDFRTTFPQPTDQALEAGTILPEDNHPANIKAITEEHAREALSILHDIDAVSDARRRGVDPSTGKSPRTHASRERLRQSLPKELERLKHAFDVLMDVYGDAFGFAAQDAFTKSLIARHAGIEVAVAEKSHSARVAKSHRNAPIAPKTPRRISSRLPVPKPLPEAVSAGRFGMEDGKSIRPDADEVRAITETHAQKIIELLDELRSAPQVNIKSLQGKIQEAFKAYAEDFGEDSATRLAAYVTRQSHEQIGSMAITR